jgi:parallel beta-helix repeat protein
VTCPVAQPAIATTFVLTNGSNAGCNGSTNVAYTEAASPNCALKTINKGVSVATTTVNVGAGTYNEDVSIGKALTLKGANFGVDARTGVATRVAETVVVGTSSTFTIGADNVVIDGFTVKGTDPGSPNGASTGVTYSPAKSNTTLQNTIITDNVIGVYPSCVSSCTIQRNLFDSNNFDGAAGGAGIYTDFTTNGLIVTQNEFKGHSRNSSVIFGSATAGTHQNLTFTSNLVQSTLAASAVYVFDVTNGNFSSNRILQSAGTGISLGGGDSNITIQNNDFTGSMRGVRLQKDIPNFGSSGAPVPNNSAVEVHLNAFVNNAQYGVNLVDSYTGTLNASRNWWGNANGPTNGANTGGTGTAVMGSPVDFSPWLGDGTDTSANIGFQPNLTPLFALATDGINVAPTAGLTTTENGGTAQFAVVLASAPTSDVTIPLSSSNTNEGTVNPTSLTFTPANWNVPQTVTVTGVALAPANGNVAYTIVTGLATSTDPNFNGLTVADVSVTNNSAVVPSISIADATVAEGTSGPATMTFNVTLSQASPNTVSVSYGTQDQTATSGANGDYVAAIGTVSFAPGETAKTINVAIAVDTNTKQAETFLVNLTSPSGATISRGQATGTIQDSPLASLSCAPRADFVVQTQSIGSRQMLVTITAGTTGANSGNLLRTIQFKTPTNATITMAGQTTIGTGAITLPADTRRISFTVTQTSANAAFQVAYTITDNCGPAEKFVGGGANALN